MKTKQAIAFALGGLTAAAAGGLVARFQLGRRRADRVWASARCPKLKDVGTVKHLTILPLIDWYTARDPSTGPSTGSGQASGQVPSTLRLRSGQALRLRSGQALVSEPGSRTSSAPTTRPSSSTWATTHRVSIPPPCCAIWRPWA